MTTKACDLRSGDLIDVRLPTGETLIHRVEKADHLPFLELPLVELTVRDVTPAEFAGSGGAITTRLVAPETHFNLLHA